MNGGSGWHRNNHSLDSARRKKIWSDGCPRYNWSGPGPASTGAAGCCFYSMPQAPPFPMDMELGAKGLEYETGTTTTAGRSKLKEQNKLTQVLALHGLIDEWTDTRWNKHRLGHHFSCSIYSIVQYDKKTLVPSKQGIGKKTYRVGGRWLVVYQRKAWDIYRNMLYTILCLLPEPARRFHIIERVGLFTFHIDYMIDSENGYLQYGPAVKRGRVRHNPHEISQSYNVQIWAGISR